MQVIRFFRVVSRLSGPIRVAAEAISLLSRFVPSVVFHGIADKVWGTIENLLFVV